MRIILWHLFLVVLPFILYWTYASLQSRKRTTPGGALQDVPINLLFGSGLALAIISMVIVGFTGEQKDPNSTYRPTRIEDGKLVPGEVVKPE